MTKTKCKNPHCQCFFIPDRFNQHHQEYCTRPECRRIRNAVRRRRWREQQKQDPEFRRQEVKRVQRYRQQLFALSGRQTHKPAAPQPLPHPDPFFIDATQKIAIGLISLQNRLHRQQLVVVGIAEQLLGNELPDALPRFLDQCRQRGQDLYRLDPAQTL